MPKKVQKVQVGFDENALSIIERLQMASGAATMAEVLRDALGFYDWACEQIEQGYAVGAFKAGAPTKEVVLFRQARRASSTNMEKRAAAAAATEAAAI